MLDSLEKAGVDFEIIKTKITYGSKEKLHWYCPECKKLYDILIKDNPNIPKFYIQEYQVQNKTRSKKHCRICNHGSNTVISGVNDFITRCKLNKDKYGHLIEEWHPDNIVKPNKIALNYTKKVYWKCPKCGYGTKGEWFVSPNSRIEDSKNNKINGCPACAGKELLKGYNDFETRCNDKEYQKEYKKKYNKDLKLLLKEWNEAENSKIITKNGKPLTKDNILFGSGDEVAWICSDSKCRYGKNGEWRTPLKARTLSGRGCPICSGNIVVKGYNDIATTHPKIAEQWDEERNLKEFGRTKYNTSKGYNNPVWWTCEKEHHYKASPNDRTGKKHIDCSICSNKELLQGYNDLETFCNAEENKEANKHLLEEWHEYNKMKPSEVVWGSDKIVKWKCSDPECGHEWETAVRHRVTYIQKNGKLHKGTWCDKCARKQKALNLRMKKTKGKELSKLNPELAQEWHPDPNKNYSKKYDFILTPDNTSANSKDKVWWKCSNPECRHEWIAQVYARNKGSGCPECYKRRRKNETAT